MNWYQNYESVLSLFERDNRVDETMFYFRSDPKKIEHYIGCQHQNEKPYWAGYCDIPDGSEFATAKELFEAKIYDGKSIKDRWDELVLVSIGGIYVEDCERSWLKEYSYRITEKLETPFGNIYVRVNGKPIPFRLRIDSYEDDKNAPSKPVLMQIIEVNLTGMKRGDIIFCGFNSNILEYNDGDERSIIYSCNDEKSILGLCAFEPDDESAYCYRLEEYTGNGFGYRITVDPGDFDGGRFYKSKIISLAVSCLNKSDYEDADLVTFLALTNVIG